MRETVGDIWSLADDHVIVIPANGSLSSRDGRAVLSRGVGRMAAERDDTLRARLGLLIADRGNHVHDLGGGIVSFPVEHGMSGFADIALIERSGRELALMADEKGWERVALPHVGCGYGGLSWDEVAPVVGTVLDDRFVAVGFAGAETASL